jgi:branched-chain amino acid transport system substrate-binding protein
MNKKGLLAVIAVVLVAFLCWLFLGNKGGNEASGAVKIGAVLPLTGSVANLGQENKAGIELALEKVNKNGVKIEVVYEDGQGDAKTSVSAMKKLEMQGINKVILSTTQTIIPILSMYKNNDKFFFSANSSTKGIVDSTNNAMRLYFSSEEETSMVANYIIKSNFKKVATFRINTESCLEPIETTKGKILTQNSQNTGIKFFDQTFEFSDRDYRTKFASIKNFDPEVLFICSYPDQWENIVKQLAEQKMNYPIIANSGFGQIAEREFYKDLEIMKLIVFPAPNFVLNKEKPEIKQVIADLKEKYNVVANYNVLYLYDNIMVIANNLEFAKDNKEFISAICGKEYTGITGKIQFNDRCDVKITDLSMVKIVDGKYELIKE